MGLATERGAFVNAVAREIDRLVVRGHELAGEYTDKPPAVLQLTALPELLSFAAIVLLERPLTREDIARIVPYTPRSMIDGLIDNNIAEGVVSEVGEQIALTDQGRAAAEGFVSLQETVMVDAWSAVPDQVTAVDRFLTPVVEHGRDVGPPRTPSNFALFASVCKRPTVEARTLRLITAVRYWRADAHAVALAEAGLEAFEAHALNCLWDAHREVTRVGQGFPRPGSKGVASLETRGLASGGTITSDGIALREQVEHETDRLTAPIYESLDEATQDELLAGLRALPS